MNKEKPLPMARINTRIKVSQQKFIKAQAKRTGETEGEIFRNILAEHILSTKK